VPHQFRAAGVPGGGRLASDALSRDTAKVSLTLQDWRRRVAAAYAAARVITEIDPVEAWTHWRQERDELFAQHPDSPLEDRAGFTGLPFAAYDPAWCFDAPVQRAEPLTLDVQTSDGVVPLRRIGVARLPFGTLDVWWVAVYGGGLFVPFADATNGTTSYGGGRYLVDTVKGADLGGAAGELRLDFNYAYHPSCFYSPRWSCPLAPAGNRLAVPVAAGERATADRSS
jgi:uncharacterized protein (DUF1684 family)